MNKLIKKFKIMTILGTRPEIIRLSRILPKMDDYFDHKVVYTQQNYDHEMSKIFFEEFKLREPDYLLNVKSSTIGGQLANIFRQSEELFVKENPDAVFVLGDTNSILSVIIAKRMHIPIFHMEAGTRCFDWEHPEEINRVIVDKISDYNICYVEHNRRNLIREGLPLDSLFVTGSPMREVLEYYSGEIDASRALDKFSLTPGNYFVVSAHREENVDNQNRLKSLFDTFNYIADFYKHPIIVTLHPRTKKRLTETMTIHPNIKICKPFGFFDYVKLQKNSSCVLSDSGTLEEESAMLGFPAVFIRAKSQHPEVYDTGAMILAGVKKDSIINAIKLVLDQRKKGEKIISPRDYNDANVSTRVVKLIMGLTGVKKYYL